MTFSGISDALGVLEVGRRMPPVPRTIKCMQVGGTDRHRRCDLATDVCIYSTGGRWVPTEWFAKFQE